MANFRNRIEKYLSQTSAKQSAETRRWLSENICAPQFDEFLKDYFAQMSVGSDANEHDVRKERVRANIANILAAAPRSAEEKNEKHNQTASAPKRKRLSGVISWAISSVAIVALVIVMGLWYNQTPVEWTIVRTDATEQKEVLMPDGSTIWLNGGSEIIYPSRFEGENRTVYASGELYADIVKNPECPFIVDTKDVVAKVFGTKFNMKSYVDSRTVEIALVEGAVTMLVDGESKQHRLTRGDIVRYDRKERKFETYRFEPFNYATWKDNGNLYFVNMHLGDIVGELENKFGVEIIIEDSSLNDLCYYASFVNNEDIDQILHALNARRNMQIRRQGDCIYLAKR